MFARNGIGVITIDTDIGCPMDDTLTSYDFQNASSPRASITQPRKLSGLDEFERSGLSGCKFAELAGFRYQTFATWVQKRRAKMARSPNCPLNAESEIAFFRFLGLERISRISLTTEMVPRQSVPLVVNCKFCRTLGLRMISSSRVCVMAHVSSQGIASVQKFPTLTPKEQITTYEKKTSFLPSQQCAKSRMHGIRCSADAGCQPSCDGWL